MPPTAIPGVGSGLAPFPPRPETRGVHLSCHWEPSLPSWSRVGDPLRVPEGGAGAWSSVRAPPRPPSVSYEEGSECFNFCFKGKVELHGKIMEVDYSVSKKLR